MNLFGEEEVSDVEVAPAAGASAGGVAYSVWGHEAVEARLLSFIQSGRLPHGLIFFGPKGIGKSLMARRFAARLLVHGAEEASDTLDVPEHAQAVQLMRACGHPDYLFISRPYDDSKDKYKEAITIDDVRKIGGFLSLTSTDGGWRVVVIDDADLMNRNAQNAVLKVLEEPPQRTVLILVAHRLGPLLPTILSRTHRLQFSHLSDDVLEGLFMKELPDVPRSDYPALLDFAQGSIGRAADFSEHEGPEIYKQVAGILEMQSPDWGWIHKLGDSMAKSAQRPLFDNFEAIVLAMAEKASFEKARGQASSFFAAQSLEQILGVHQELSAHFTQVRQANLDNRAAVLGAFRIMLAS